MLTRRVPENHARISLPSDQGVCVLELDVFLGFEENPNIRQDLIRGD